MIDSSKYGNQICWLKTPNLGVAFLIPSGPVDFQDPFQSWMNLQESWMIWIFDRHLWALTNQSAPLKTSRAAIRK